MLEEFIDGKEIQVAVVCGKEETQAKSTTKAKASSTLTTKLMEISDNTSGAKLKTARGVIKIKKLLPGLIYIYIKLGLRIFWLLIAISDFG